MLIYSNLEISQSMTLLTCGMIRHIIISIILIVTGIDTLNVYSQTIIHINDFGAAVDDLELMGSSKVHEKFLRLTPSVENMAGSCWFTEEKIDLTRGFETEFEFRVVDGDKTKGIGDGFAFVIQNQQPTALGQIGDGLGYLGITDAIVIEFDTYDNNEGSRNHIDIAYYEEGLATFRRHATVHSIPEITDGKPHFARVHYKDGFLTLYLDSYIFPVLSSKLDIPDIIQTPDGRAWIGFTAATSSAISCHDLMSWHLNYYLDAPEDIVEEKVKVEVAYEIPIKNRKFTVSVRDYNKIDDDVLSLKFGDHWVLTEHKLTGKNKTIDLTLTGFSMDLIMFANSIGKIPPNTAAVVIDDGVSKQEIKLKADFESSDAIRIYFDGETPTE